MLTLAVREPPAVGVNVTLTLQLAPATKELPHVFFWLKSEALAPVMPILDRLRAALPVFTNMIVAGLLLVP
jgi:hypothetical protein